MTTLADRQRTILNRLNHVVPRDVAARTFVRVLQPYSATRAVVRLLQLLLYVDAATLLKGIEWRYELLLRRMKESTKGTSQVGDSEGLPHQHLPSKHP